MRETDLDPPVRAYLEKQGYRVHSEVHGCDLTATRGDELVVVELKRSPSMTLLVQATQRQLLTDSVYVGVPEPKPSRQWQGIQRVLRRLELGLIVVRGTRAIKVFDPGPYQRRKAPKRRRAVIREIELRTSDHNVGGSTGVALVTAYREEAVQIAALLAEHGPMTPKALRASGTSARTGKILYDNHYGWFRRVDRGIYELTEVGSVSLESYRHLLEV